MMERSELDARMDARIEEGEREARAWLSRYRWGVAAVIVSSVGLFGAGAGLYLSDPGGEAYTLALLLLFLPLIGAVVLIDKPAQIRMEARRDAALMELEYANARMASSDDVEVSWWDRLRYGPRSLGVMLAFYGVIFAFNVRSVFDPTKNWAFEAFDAALWLCIGWLALMRLLKQEKQEQLAKARVMYREAAEAGADLRGAFGLAVTTSGELEVKEEGSEHSGVGAVVLDLDVVEADSEVGDEVTARR
jgi:hypothetical protein